MRLIKSAYVIAVFAGLAGSAGFASAESVDECPEALLEMLIGCGPSSERYVAVRGGVIQAGDTDFTLNGVGGFDTEYDVGFAVSGALGRKLPDLAPGIGLRAEIELGYQEAEVDSHMLGGVAAAGSTGSTSVLFGFLNLYGDVPLSPELDLFLGGGVGAGAVAFDDHAAQGVLAFSDRDIAFGYHLDAGLSYEISEDVSLEATYRFSSFPGVEANSAGGAQGEIDIDSHQVLLGLRVKF